VAGARAAGRPGGFGVERVVVVACLCGRCVLSGVWAPLEFSSPTCGATSPGDPQIK
jgi:hypothetical protein